MQIFQLVYTKVAPDESPHKEADFHTLFYPISLLTKQDVYEIERRIHFPGAGFTAKETVFYQNLHGKDHLIILHIHNLPEARDTFGRGGIFICHGFIFPPEIWKLSSHPMALFELIKDNLFMSREDALRSPLANRQTGDMQPIEISKEALMHLPKDLPELASELEQKLVISLLKIASAKENYKILIKGTPDAICQLMNRLFAYIPDALKPNLGWDAALDGGSLTFYPLIIAGYKNTPPKGTVSLKIDIAAQQIEEAEKTSMLLLPHTPIEKWLYSCKKEITSKEDIEGAYKLSLLIEDKIESSITKGLLHQRTCFAEINKKEIKESFIKACRIHLPEQITERIVARLSPDAMLSLIIENTLVKRLADCTEQVLIKNKLRLKEPLSQSLLTAGSKKLKLIGKLYRENKLSLDDIKSLNQEDRFELIAYILLIERQDKDWILDILKNDEECFCHILSSDPTKRVLTEMIKARFEKDKEYSQIAQILLIEAIIQNKTFSLLREEINPMEIIETLLKEKQLNEEYMKSLILWAKKRRPPKAKFLYIKAFLYPREGIPEEFLKDAHIKSQLISWLKLHKYSQKELMKLGLVEPKPEKKGLLGRVKEIFDFGGNKR